MFCRGWRSHGDDSHVYRLRHKPYDRHGSVELMATSAPSLGRLLLNRYWAQWRKFLRCQCLPCDQKGNTLVEICSPPLENGTSAGVPGFDQIADSQIDFTFR